MPLERAREQVIGEVEELRARLREAEETLRAIQQGEVDALVITERAGEKVYTLKSADRPYRMMIEGMGQGAVTLTADGTILYCNTCFAQMMKRRLESVIGGSLHSFLDAGSRDLFEALLRQEGNGAQGEVALRAANGTLVPAYVAVTALVLEDGMEPVTCLVVTDLTEQKKGEQIVADEKLARSILEHATQAMVVCDTGGKILRASREAHDLCGRNMLLEPFETAFPLEFGGGEIPDARSFLALPLAGERLQGIEAGLGGSGRDRLDLLLSAGPLWGAGGQVEGCVVTFTDITARRQTERELERAWAAAQATNAAKDRFLATLSHELRTPLTPVLAVISSLEASGRCPAELRHEMDMVRRNVELEARLIDDLLDLTRISRGKLELRRQGINLRRILEHAVETCCGEEATAGRLRVVMELAAHDHHLWADGSRLTQVFWNLLSNSVKFTPAGGTITVRSWKEKDADRVAVEVADTGVGIEPDLLPRIFDAFEQGEVMARRFGGLGLGLAISKAIVELHGGNLSVQSPGPNQGAVFTVCLPVGPGRVQEDLETSSDSGQTDVENRASLHILLVEDHVDTAEAMAGLLEVLGHRVTVAGTVAEALAAAAALQDGPGQGIDLLVSDLGLPDGSGLDLMRELSHRYGLKGIALSGYGMEEDLRRSREAGFEKHLTKPINVDSLQAVIHEVAGE
ncbi:MAG TPA: ATP-binding protein [Thermoanaerobaculia bacterium]|nr:ATP-binding protein [Thermoanaerobaculia bacterium]